MKKLCEWYIKAPWGKLAVVSWGTANSKPVLLVHGRQDSLDTFLPLLEHLSDKYYYVGVDLPGHGKSDAFPVGVMMTRLSSVSAIVEVIRHLKWSQFTYIGHSYGAELGTVASRDGNAEVTACLLSCEVLELNTSLFYNVLYPGDITKLILLDVTPGLQRLQVTDLPYYFKEFYNQYYSNYTKYNIDSRTYTKEQALHAVMKARGLSREEAEVILERNLRSIGGDKYKLSWDMRLKIIAPIHLSQEFYSQLLSMDAPPSLYINAKSSQGQFYDAGKDAVNKIFNHLQRNVGVLYKIDVEGSHDVHFTNPERMGKEICAFMDKIFPSKSKL